MDILKQTKRFLKYTTIALLGLAGVLFSLPLQADELINRTLQISDSAASATGVNYRISFNRATAAVIGSVVIQICSNSPLPDEPCQASDGFSWAASSIIEQTGITDFTIHANSTDNVLILTRTPNFEPTGSQSITLDAVINPSVEASHYGRINTYASEDGSGMSIDGGGVVFRINPRLDITTTVPPFLGFCVAQTIQGYDCATAENLYVDLGTFSHTYTTTGTSQLVVVTNAGSGYSVTIFGTTLTSGNNIIKAMVPPHASNVGTEQFGMNLVANTNPAVGNDPVGPGTANPTADYALANRFKYVSGDVIINGSGVTDWRKFTTSYIVNINQNQKPGIYTTTFTFICLANF